MERSDPNLAMLQLAADGLGTLLEDVVFVGGCAAGLLITDLAAPPTRETKDVDVIVEITSHADYHQLSGKLKERGFREDVADGAPMCRWLFGAVTVDVMPTDERILGFSNRWYKEAMVSANRVRLPAGMAIRMVAAPWFLATKLEAFYGRGKDDYMARSLSGLSQSAAKKLNLALFRPLLRQIAGLFSSKLDKKCLKSDFVSLRLFKSDRLLAMILKI